MPIRRKSSGPSSTMTARPQRGNPLAGAMPAAVGTAWHTQLRKYRAEPEKLLPDSLAIFSRLILYLSISETIVSISTRFNRCLSRKSISLDRWTSPRVSISMWGIASKTGCQELTGGSESDHGLRLLSQRLLLPLVLAIQRQLVDEVVEHVVRGD